MVGVLGRVVRAGVALVVSVTGLSTATGCAPDLPPPLAIEKRTLARFDREVRLLRLVTSDDGVRQAWLVETPDGGCRVTQTGTTPHSTYRECGQRTFAFARERGPLVYDARDAAGVSWLVVDGVTHAMPDARTVELATDDRGWWAAVARAEGAATMWSANSAGGPWIAAGSPAFSPDGRVAAIVRPSGDAALALVVDGIETARHMPASTRCGAGTDPQTEAQVAYLSDGRLVQVVPAGDGWSVLRDGTAMATYPAVVPLPRTGQASTADTPCADEPGMLIGSLVVAEDDPVAVWWERIGGGADLRWRVVRDGTPVDDVTCRWPSYDTPIALDPSGRHVAYACSVGDAGPTAQVYAVLDGRRFGPHRQVWGLAVSPDGSHLAWTGAAGGSAAPWRVYRDGVPLSPSYRSIWPPKFAPDSRHVAWEALEDREGRGVAGIDGRPVARFDGILSGPLFPRPDRVAWVYLRGRRVVRLDVELR